MDNRPPSAVLIVPQTELASPWEEGVSQPRPLVGLCHLCVKKPTVQTHVVPGPCLPRPPTEAHGGMVLTGYTEHQEVFLTRKASDWQRCPAPNTVAGKPFYWVSHWKATGEIHEHLMSEFKERFFCQIYFKHISVVEALFSNDPWTVNIFPVFSRQTASLVCRNCV